MGKKLAILTIFSIFLILPLCFADATQIVLQKQSGEATISPLGEAKFQITVKNNNAADDLFTLQLSDVSWSLITQSAADLSTGISLGGYSSANTTVYIKPADPSLSAGTYYVELRIRSDNTKDYSSEVFAIRIDPKVVDYSIKIPSEILEPTSIDPSRTNSIKVLVKNPYPVFLANVTVSASSKFLNKKVAVDIPPYSEKVIDFSLNLDASTPKQQDTLNIEVDQGDKVISTTSKPIYIKEYRLPYKSEETVSDLFLHRVHTITFTNTEGGIKTQDVPVIKPITYAYLYTSPASSTQNFDGADYFVWTDVKLNPGDSYVVTYTEDYRQAAGFGLIILIGIILYFRYRSPIVVTKKGFAIHKKDTGNNEIKVMLHVRNRSSRFLEKVRVLDRLPIIHRVEEDFGPGTPEPKYRRTADGFILDWDIALAPKEERIFTYKVKSSLPIVGEYELKPCVVQYGKRNRRTSSGPYRMLID